jgi:Rieske Fe-S protein
MTHAAPPPPHPTGAVDDSARGPDRRGLILGLAVTAAAGAAGYVLASGDRSPATGQGDAAPAPTGAAGGGNAPTKAADGGNAPTEAADGGNAPTGAAGGGNEKPLVSLADLPQDGGVVDKETGVVVTRTGDQVRAFSAECTHQGCLVNSVSGGTIKCECHGSRFDAATGSVVRGPAPRPLPPVRVEVRDGAVFRT